MRRPLPVRDLHTRLLERKQVLRSYVRDVEVVDAQPTSLVLDTVASVPGPVAPLVTGEPGVLGDRTDRPGRLRIDLLSDSLFRVRYAEGPEVPANETPMVVGSFGGPRVSEIDVAEERIEYVTSAARIQVSRKPLAIRVERDGRTICEIGGREKNLFQVWDSYNTGICRTASGDPLAVECFTLRSHEAVYGLGEHFQRLNRVGQTIDLDMREALGTGSPRSYKNVPFFLSTCGYGVFFNHSSRMTVWIGSLYAADLQIALEDDFLDYYVILGNPKQTLSQYTDITGKGCVPPAWSFGYWQSKISYSSAEEALEVARGMRAASVPLDVLHLDTHWFDRDWYCDLEFSKVRFPDPRAFSRELADLGIRLSLWQLPYIPEGCRLFDDLAAVDGFVKDGAGETYDVGVCMVEGFTGRVGCIDFTNPEARRVYGDYLRRLFELGATVIKVDFGEQAPLDGVYHDGTPGHRMHNLYPLLYNRCVSEVTRQATGQGLIWARSAWAGSQRYPVHWGGDSSANWYGMLPQFEGGLSLGLSGFQFWSQDIGGFAGLTGGELLIRWMQAGMFFSHARIHGMGDRELYKFDEEVLRICRDYIRMRYRLLPYILGSAEDCVARSLPLARALVIEYPDDPNVWNIGNQWLFGGALLVAPITTPRGEREVYLPAGLWRDWWTGAHLSGGRWLHVQVDLETLPLYVREGAIVPLGPLMQRVDEFPVEEILLRIAPFERAGESRLTVPVNGERVSVRYLCDGGHRVEIAPSPVRFRVEVLGEERTVEIVGGAGGRRAV